MGEEVLCRRRVKDLAHAALGKDEARLFSFFNEGYALDLMIHGATKPVIVLAKGITMGEDWKQEPPIMDVSNREIAGVKKHIQQLLADCGLPCDDKTLSHLQHFLVMKKDDREVVGVVGLELLPPAALIHSLAVQKSYRRQGLASQLLEEIEAYARAAGYGELYLAAGQSVDLFSQWGYHPLVDKDLPAFLHTALELQITGPGDVVYMCKDLKSSNLKKEE